MCGGVTVDARGVTAGERDVTVGVPGVTVGASRGAVRGLAAPPCGLAGYRDVR